MIFEQRKIQKETLGEYLTVIRTSQSLSLPAVAAATGVTEKFLELLEAGRYSELPPDVYTCGFLRRLALYYRIDPEEILPQYKKERDISLQLGSKIIPVSRVLWRKFLIVTPARISIAGLLLFILATVGYVLYEVRSINHVPVIVLDEPVNGAAVKDSFVRASGHTDAGNQLAINGADVLVAEDGRFATTISVGSGTRQLDFVARNKFGKQSSRVISIVGQTGPGAVVAPNPTAVTLVVRASSPVTITVTVDGKPLSAERVETGETRQFTAAGQLLLSTSNAGSTHVTVNGQSLGPLGRAGEALRDIPFTPASTLLVKAPNSVPASN